MLNFDLLSLAIDDPRFTSVQEAHAWLKPAEAVILLQINDDARTYPLQILMWHELVNAPQFGRSRMRACHNDWGVDSGSAG